MLSVISFKFYAIMLSCKNSSSTNECWIIMSCVKKIIMLFPNPIIGTKRLHKPCQVFPVTAVPLRRNEDYIFLFG